MKHYLYSLTAIAVSVLVACGGGGGEGASDNSQASASTNQQSPPSASAASFAVEKESYTSGERLPLRALVPDAQSAVLAFAGDRKVNVPLLPDGTIVMPAIPAELARIPATLNVATSTNSVTSNSFVLQQINVPTSTPGIPALVYADMAMANLTAGIEDLTAKNARGPALDDLINRLALMTKLVESIIASQQGRSAVMMTTGSGSQLMLDRKVLEALDQNILAVMAITGNQGQGQDFKNPNTSNNVVIQPPNCDRFPAADRALCQNLYVRNSSDLFASSSGLVTTTNGVSAAITSVLGVATAGIANTVAAAPVITPAGILATATAATVVLANAIGISAQAISAYNSETPEGVGVRRNITDLVGQLQDLSVRTLAPLLPRGSGSAGPDLVTEFNDAAIKLEVAALVNAVSTVTAAPATIPSIQALPTSPSSIVNSTNQPSNISSTLVPVATGLIPDRASTLNPTATPSPTIPAATAAASAPRIASQ